MPTKTCFDGYRLIPDVRRWIVWVLRRWWTCQPRHLRGGAGEDRHRDQSAELLGVPGETDLKSLMETLVCVAQNILFIWKGINNNVSRFWAGNSGGHRSEASGGEDQDVGVYLPVQAVFSWIWQEEGGPAESQRGNTVLLQQEEGGHLREEADVQGKGRGIASEKDYASIASRFPKSNAK